MNSRAPRLVPTLLAGLLFCLGLPAIAADRLVLIVSARSQVDSLNSLEIQKLFLGLTVVSNGAVLHPLRNESDELMRQIFFQSIISMSEPSYDRRVLALTLQQGRTGPPLFRDEKALIDAVAGDPAAVSFAWSADVAHNPRVRILRVLWHE